MKFGFLRLVFGLGLLSSLCSGAASPPNVIIFMADDMGMADAHPYFGKKLGPNAAPIAATQVTFNILAPGVTEDHIAAGFTRRSGNGEWSGSLTYAPSQTVKGSNTFDPTQQISLSMDQWMLQFSYSWLR